MSFRWCNIDERQGDGEARPRCCRFLFIRGSRCSEVVRQQVCHLAEQRLWSGAAVFSEKIHKGGTTKGRRPLPIHRPGIQSSHGGHRSLRYACAPLQNANEGKALVPAFVWVHHRREHRECMAHLQEGLRPSQRETDAPQEVPSVGGSYVDGSQQGTSQGWPAPSAKHKPQVRRPNPRVLHPTQEVRYDGGKSLNERRTQI